MSFSADEIRARLGVKPQIDPAVEISRRVQFLVEYCLTSGSSGFAVGISGGQDSTLTGKLCQMAAQELRRRGEPAEFYALRLPYRVQSDAADAQLAIDYIDPDHDVELNIEAGTDGLVEAITAAVGEEISDFNKGNVKARIRMSAAYAVAGAHNLLVVGTDHAAEAVTGFFTKYGDGGVDVLPLAGLSKRQGTQLLQRLDGPARFWEKAPTADLLDLEPGQADEDSLGLTYEQIDDFLEGRPVPEKVTEALERRFQNTEHKRTSPVTPTDQWWIRC